MAEYLTNDTELKSVANAIRTKTGGSTNLIYPSGFASAIQGIAADCTAAASEIMSGKTAYVGNSKITCTMSTKAAATYNVSSSDQTIAAGQYLSGAQTIRKVTTANLSAGNIKAGVTVKVGDAADDDRIAGVAGTFTSDANAAAGHILSGKTAYVNGSKVTGSISSKAAATYNTSTSDQTIASGQYLSGAQTIRKVTTANLSAGNIKAGVTVKVGDTADDDRIAGVAGTFTSDATAAAGHILSGKTAYVNGSKITGTIASKAATTYNVSSSDQTIASGQYLSGAQTIRAVTTANLSAANIKRGVTVTVGDAGSASRIASVTGTCQEVSTSMPVSADCYVPFMFKTSDAFPVAFYWDGSGWKVSGGGSNTKYFIVPCPIKMTYYAESTSSSTSSVTFSTGTVYALSAYSNTVAQIYGGSLSTFHVYKITKFEIA